MDILEIKNVAYSYANSKEKVLSGVNQKFELGKFYAIVGKSGTGKSTLLSLLAGLDKPQTGKILFKNEDIQKKGYSNHRKNSWIAKLNSSLFKSKPEVSFANFPQKLLLQIKNYDILMIQ